MVTHVFSQQEFSNGGRLYLGGIEAYEEVCQGNAANIQHLCDCRGDNKIDRLGRHHDWRKKIPKGVSYQQLQLNRLAVIESRARGHIAPTLKYAHEFQERFQPLLDAVARGESILVFCVNGKNRSPTAVLIVYAVFLQKDMVYRRDHDPMWDIGDAVLMAAAEILRLRALVELDNQHGADTNHVSPVIQATVFLFAGGCRNISDATQSTGSSDFRLQTSDFEFEISDFRFQVSGFAFHIPDFRFQISDLRFAIRDLRVHMDLTTTLLPGYLATQLTNDLLTNLAALLPS